ncbi:hypothetical protein AB0J86_15165 [Micromonospora sp. NPDC049559]|uniref:YqeB family protein n=1 Tax=Micromonospora sp. NPDC049559 TaxID=3155923 RepID=UPI00342C2FD2
MFGLPAAGLLLGLVLPAVARGAIELPGPLPFGAVFRGLAAVDAPWEMALGALAGLVLGTVLALTSLGESTTVTVTDAELRLDRDSYHGAVRRAEVAAVFLDGRTLVVLDPGSRQLVRERCPAPAAQVAAGLRAHGYPWRDADPYADRYRRWVPESPQLPPAVGALLAARRTALGKKAHREVRELRAAVEELGYTVRDEDGAQYWRSLEPVD